MEGEVEVEVEVKMEVVEIGLMMSLRGWNLRDLVSCVPLPENTNWKVFSSLPCTPKPRRTVAVTEVTALTLGIMGLSLQLRLKGKLMALFG